ncbi:MAG TPA: EVE domain-containing protein [Cytophagales bacterium]|jgi:predicted RNA-binding protein with PUA-like domain|nr:EVE domain-containing protein [Cytophagales bacterium]
MNYWILKSEPNVYAYDDLVKQGTGTWDGVRNYTARNNLRNMQVGDLALFYHSNIGKEVVGVARIVKEAFPDPTTEDNRWLAVEVVAEKKLEKPVTLAQLKADGSVNHIGLVKQSRLSVIPIEKSDFDYILKLSQQ